MNASPATGSPPSPQTPYQTALEYISRGWRVLPLHHINKSSGDCSCGRPNCSSAGKHPISAGWQQTASTDSTLVDGWFKNSPERNIGVATGRDSGIFVLDVDGDEGYAALAELVAEHGELPETWSVRTGSGGAHFYLAYPDDVEIRNSASKIASHLDIRGDGGMVVAPPSVSAKGPYVVTDESDVAQAPQWLVDLILAAAPKPKQLEEVPEWDGRELTEREESYLNGVVAGLCRDLSDVTEGRHEMIYRCGLRVGSLTAGAGLDAEGAVETLVEAALSNPSIASVYTEYDIERTLKDGIRQGLESPSAVPKPEFEFDEEDFEEWLDELDGEDAGGGDEDDEDETIRSTWAPCDLTPFIEGTYTPPVADILMRSDGHGLFYAGKTHAVLGESESGKSWITLSAIASEIEAGNTCLYIDPEDSPGTAVMRLKALGVSDEGLRERFVYVQPEIAHNKGTADDKKAWRALMKHTFSLAVIDGMNAILATYGASSDSNDDVTAFMNSVPNIIARRTGAAVAIVDHVTKSTDGRGRFAIGAQAKLSTLTGCSYMVDVRDVFAPGQPGVLEMRVGKDRPGAVRAVSTDARKTDRTQLTATVSIESDAAGGANSMKMQFLAPGTSVSDAFVEEMESYRLHQAVYDFIEDAVADPANVGFYPTLRQVRKGVVGGNADIGKVVTDMLQDGILVNHSPNSGYELDLGDVLPPWITPESFSGSSQKSGPSTGCGKPATDRATDHPSRAAGPAVHPGPTAQDRGLDRSTDHPVTFERGPGPSGPSPYKGDGLGPDPRDTHSSIETDDDFWDSISLD